jgi:hypothetical protein
VYIPISHAKLFKIFISFKVDSVSFSLVSEFVNDDDDDDDANLDSILWNNTEMKLSGTWTPDIEPSNIDTTITSKYA